MSDTRTPRRPAPAWLPALAGVALVLALVLEVRLLADDASSTVDRVVMGAVCACMAAAPPRPPGPGAGGPAARPPPPRPGPDRPGQISSAMLSSSRPNSERAPSRRRTEITARIPSRVRYHSRGW